MSRLFRPSTPPLLAALLAAVVAGGCGKKGPPLAPLTPTPQRVEDFVVRRIGEDVHLQMTVPARNQDGRTPADLRTLEVFALTGRPADALGRRLSERELVGVAARVASVEIAPPPADDAPAHPQAPPPPRDPRPAQGDRLTVVEHLGPEQRVVWTPPADRRAVPVPPAPAERVIEGVALSAWIGPLVSPPETRLQRHYAAAGRSRKGRLGRLSPIVAIDLGETPPTPLPPRVTYDEARILVEWDAPPGARRPIQVPASGEGVLPARPVFPGPPAHTYNVYGWGREGRPAAGVLPVALNRSPLGATRFEQAGVEFGVERCFAVATAQVARAASVESTPSAGTCVTPRDTFPPAPPRQLSAVGGEGAINLIWEANAEPDLAGYLVLRGEAGASELRAVTTGPVTETIYRDTGVRAGVRYVYAVVAVDDKSPPNISLQSNRVEETAR